MLIKNARKVLAVLSVICGLYFAIFHNYSTNLSIQVTPKHEIENNQVLRTGLPPAVINPTDKTDKAQEYITTFNSSLNQIQNKVSPKAKQEENKKSEPAKISPSKQDSKKNIHVHEDRSNTTVKKNKKETPIPKVEKQKWGDKPYTESRSFQILDDGSLLVYSAYVDADKHIRIFGIVRRVNYHPNLTCLVWASNPPARDEVPLRADFKIVVLPEHHNKRHSAGYVLCRRPLNASTTEPLVVTLSIWKGSNSSRAVLPVHQKEKWSSEFTMCIPPLFKKYDRNGTVIEMIEFNRVLGATKFFFYNYSVGAGVSEILNHYKQKGIVEVIDWRLPGLSEYTKDKRPALEIHYFGQLTAMNDCVYRNRHQSKYVVLTDMDEFIVPNITSNLSTWGDLIAHRKKLHPKSTVFWIKNMFFRYEFSKKENKIFFDIPYENKTIKWPSVVLSNRYREDVFWDYGRRSKNIVDPLGVKIVGIHNIWEKGGYRDLVPDSQASLHHYRSLYYPTDPQKRIYDDSVLKKYGSDILKGVAKTLEIIKKNRKSR